MKIYPLGDNISHEEKTHFGLDSTITILESINHTHKYLKAYNTGKFRQPKKGEWYLSGAIVMAYKAKNDLSTKYYIAKLVKLEQKTIDFYRY